MSMGAEQHIRLMAGALTKGERVCPGLKTIIHLNPVGIRTMRQWVAEGVSVSEGYDRVYVYFRDDALFELATLFTFLVRKGIDPDEFLASCRLLSAKECKQTYSLLKDLPTRPVLLSRSQD